MIGVEILHALSLLVYIVKLFLKQNE